ncbi:hypothetical protein Ancab_023224 [Ancistrocladus abbreviatus]
MVCSLATNDAIKVSLIGEHALISARKSVWIGRAVTFSELFNCGIGNLPASAVMDRTWYLGLQLNGHFLLVRPYERRSGTGRGSEIKREGAGRGNWGSPFDEISQETEEAVAVTEVNVAAEKQVGDEGNAEAKEETPVNKPEEKEPEEKLQKRGFNETSPFGQN